MNGRAFGGGRRGETARRLEIIFVARGEMNGLRYLIETRNIYRRLAKKTRESADLASVQSSEASVAASLAEIRAYEAELHAASQQGPDGRPNGRRFSLFGFVWSSPRRRNAEASIVARDLAVAASQEAGRKRDERQGAMRECEEEAAFVAASLVRAEEALRPWSHRYQPERALSIHETALLSAIAQISDEELDLALRYGDLTPSQYRELMMLSGRDEIVRAIDCGDIQLPAGLLLEDLQEEDLQEEEVQDRDENQDQDRHEHETEAEALSDHAEFVEDEVAFVDDETAITGPIVAAGDEPAAVDSLPQDNDEALKLAADPG